MAKFLLFRARKRCLVNRPPRKKSPQDPFSKQGHRLVSGGPDEYTAAKTFIKWVVAKKFSTKKQKVKKRKEIDIIRLANSANRASLIRCSNQGQ
jgi:maltose-binding protein MalE